MHPQIFQELSFLFSDDINNVTCTAEERLFHFLELLIAIFYLNSWAACSEMLKGQCLLLSAHFIFMHLSMVERLILCTYSRWLGGLFSPLIFLPFL